MPNEPNEPSEPLLALRCLSWLEMEEEWGIVLASFQQIGGSVLLRCEWIARSGTAGVTGHLGLAQATSTQLSWPTGSLEARPTGLMHTATRQDTN